MTKIYIIGSLTRSSTIRQIADFISCNSDFEVDYVRREPEKTKEMLISECFTKIEQADIIVAVKKFNGLFGDGTFYEIEYARRRNKHVLMTSGDDFPEEFLNFNGKV